MIFADSCSSSQVDDVLHLIAGETDAEIVIKNHYGKKYCWLVLGCISLLGFSFSVTFKFYLGTWLAEAMVVHVYGRFKKFCIRVESALSEEEK